MSSDSVLPELAGRIVGPKAREVMEFLLKKGEATDEELARELNMEENELRKMLNSLYENSLVKYRRVRGQGDKLYKYFWRPADEPVVSLLESRKRKVLTILRRALESEERKSYRCPVCGTYYSFDEAADSLFRCTECDAILELAEHDDEIAKIREAIELIENATFVMVNGSE